MGKRLVLLFFLSALIFIGLSIQSKRGTNVSKLDIAEDKQDLNVSDSLLAWMTELKNESQVLRDEGNIQLSVHKLSRAIELRWREPITDEESEKLAWIYTNRAYLYHERQGDFLAAKEDYLSALRQFESCQASEYLVARYVYQPLGNIYTRLGENEIAISMLEKFKRACEESGDTEALMNAYNDIGRAHMNASKLSEAISWFSRGIKLNDKDHFNLGLLYSSKAEAEVKNENPEQSIVSAEKSLQNLDRVLQSTDPADFHHVAAQRYKVGVLSTLAKANESTKGRFYAHEYYREAAALARELYPKKHRGLARAFADLGSSWAANNDDTRALYSYQLSLNAMLDGVDLEDFSHNPKKSELFADVVIGEALIQKAKTAHKLYKKEQDSNWLQVAVNAYQTYFDWVEIQRTEQFEFYSKLGAANEIHTTGESALEAFFDMYSETNQSSWIDTAFLLMDQTKAIVLAEERGFKDLAEKNPKMGEMLKKQNALKFQRSQFQSDLLSGIGSENHNESLRLKKRISEIDEQSQLLDQDIRVMFPSYRREASKIAGNELLIKLENKLKKRNTSVLSYFVGEKSVFVITGSPTRFNFEKFARQDLVNKTIAFMEELNAPNSSSPEKYGEAGKSLFDLLIGEKDKTLDSNWLILPDGMLNGLPFEALVSSAPGRSFKSLNYLLRDHVIHYAPSSFFYAYESSGNEAEKPFLGIAPTFESSKKYDYLPKSKEELELGVSLFSGEELTDELATKKRFLKKAEGYDILHISTHAGTNSGTNNDAWMVFADGKSKNYKLEAYELLKLDLPASLVVLNACETGSGTIFQGEGPMSLARGFLNAGSKSTITNLWSVNHESNAAIMKYFYESLSKTQSPSNSLSAAKLKYLSAGEIDDASAHPYYWSAPILIGSDVSVNIPNASSLMTWVWIGLASIAAIIFGIVFFRKLRRGRA